MVTGCKPWKDYKEFYNGVEDDRIGLCNGLWSVYMFYLSKPDKHSQQAWIFEYKGSQ